MPGTYADLVARDKDVVCRAMDAVANEDIRTVEGNPIPHAAERLSMKVLMATPNVLVLRAIRKKGLTDPVHKHDNHDTVCTLVSGRLKVHIGNQSFEALPGAAWRHRPGVKHWSETLEDSVVIEIKMPPEKTW